MLTDFNAARTDSNETTETVSGFDIVMTRRGSQIVLNTISPEGSRNLGEFSNAADAWAALDEVDLQD